jgi:glycosyltransferase involved in cell wall biosynthesis
MHAFGYSLPVITNDNFESHGPEIWSFSDGFNGLSYRQGDVSDFSNKIVRLFNEPELRLRLSQNAKRTVVEKYTIEKMADGFIDAINYVQNK